MPGHVEDRIEREQRQRHDVEVGQRAEHGTRNERTSTLHRQHAGRGNRTTKDDLGQRIHASSIA